MARRGSNRRRLAERRGRLAEQIAALLLWLNGYRILANRVKTPVGEVDLIARRRGLLVFIEVKQRATLSEAKQAVPGRSWQRIARAAENWAASQTDVTELDWRFDLIALNRWGWPKHLPDFWRAQN